MEFIDIPDDKIVTGDPSRTSEAINAVTRNRKQIMESLPKQAKDILNFNVRRFNGRSTVEAENWFKDIEDWMMVNDLNLVSIFDLLLSEEALILWKEVKTPSMTNEKAREWFNETFTKKRSIMDKISDLSSVKQNIDERFATFEIRVKKLVDEVFDCGLSRESIVGFIVCNRVRNERLKDNISTKADISREEIRNLAKVYEAREGSETMQQFEEVQVIRKTSYANIAQDKQKQWNQKQPSNVYQNRTSESKFNNRNENLRQMEKVRPIAEQYSERTTTEYRAPPLVSMKHIARKVYNRCCGLPEPAEERLRPGQCYCCGQNDHMRFECPLKNKCLICGKEGHTFRDCNLLQNSRNTPRKIQRRVYCIHEEDDDRSENLVDPIMHDIENKKNQEDPVAYISSVGSRQ